MKKSSFFILGCSSLLLVGCSAYNPYRKNPRREFYIEPTEPRASIIYKGDIRNSYQEVQKNAYDAGFDTAKKLYSVDGKGNFYPHHQHQGPVIQYVDAENRVFGAGIKVEGGKIPVLIDPKEYMRTVGEPLPGTDWKPPAKKEEVIVESMSGEIKYAK